MAKKFTALMLSLALAGSIVPASVMAEEANLSFKQFNATKKVITIDFDGVSGELDSESIQNKINIQKRSADGIITTLTAQDFTFDVTKEMNGTDANGDVVVTAHANTLIITPNDGIDTDYLYKVTIDAGVADTNASVLSENVSTGWFKVEELFFDDFNVSFDDQQQPVYPYSYQGDYMTSDYYNVNNWARIHIGDDTNKIPPANYNVMRWNSNDGSFSINEKGLPLNKRKADYTVEYKYKYPANNNTSYGDSTHKLYMRSNTSSSGARFNMATGYGLYLRDDVATAGDLSAPVKFYVGNQMVYKTDSFTPDSALVDIRMSVIGDNIQCFVDNNKLIEATDSTYKDAGTTGFYDYNSTAWWAPSYMDDLSITSVYKIGEEIPTVTYNGFNADTSGISIQFAGTMDNLDPETVDFEVYENNQLIPESGYSWKVYGNEIEIMFEKPLTVKYLYEVKVSPGIKDITGISTPLPSQVTTGGFMLEEIYSNTFDDATSVNQWAASPANFTITDGQFVSNGEVDRCGMPDLTRYADYVTEADFKITSNSEFNIYTRSSDHRRYYSESSKYRVRFVNYGIILYAPDSTEIANISYSIEPDVYHHARVVNKGDRIKVYLDNEIVMDIESQVITTAGTFGVRMTGESYMDNLMLTKVTPMEIPANTQIKYNADSNAVYLDIGVDGIVNTIIDSSIGDVKLYNANGEEIESTVYIQGRYVIIDPLEEIEIGKKYTVEANGIKTSFNTNVEDFKQSFKRVEIWNETFDTEESASSEVWRNRPCVSWDNGMMKLSSTDEFIDAIYSDNFITSPNAEYITEFDLYVYNECGGMMFYSNRQHGSSYNWIPDNAINYSFGTARDISINNGHGINFYNGPKSSNFDLTKGKTYRIKTLNKNGTGMLYVNDQLEATYDYSVLVENYGGLFKGALGFAINPNTEIGIDNILITYVEDVDDSQEVIPSLSVTKSEISNPSEDGTVTANITVYNNTYEGTDYTMVVALYDIDENLIAVKAVDETEAVIGSYKEYNLSIENAGGVYSAEILLWDSLNTMIPIGEKTTVSGIAQTVVYVDPSAGSLPADGSLEAPFNNISDAVEYVKDIANQGVYYENFIIDAAKGEYFLEDTLTISDYDNILEASKSTLIINGSGTDQTFIKSGKTINNEDIYKVTDENILNRVPKGAADSIYAVNMLENGYISSSDETFELVENGKVMDTARYPNKGDGYLKTGTISENSFLCNDSRVNNWLTADNMYIYYMPNYFSYSYKVSVQNSEITAQDNVSFAQNKEYYVYNLLEELDTSGEYFYDINSAILYIYIDNFSNQKYDIYNFKNNLISLSNCSDVKIKNMTIENSGETLVSLYNTENTTLENCILRNGTKNAARVSESVKSGLLNCEIYDMGTGGVSLSGGNRQTLKKGRNFVNRCSIHDCQRLDRSYTALVSMSGVANYVVNSEIYNTYHQAITIYGNDLEIKNNKIYNVCTETSDMGAIYVEGDWTLRGTVIEHNYFENIPAKGELGAFAVYIDNGVSGITVKNNIFKDVTRQAVYVNGGRDNTITNNIFIDCGNLGAISDIYNWARDENGELLYSFDNPAPAPEKLVSKLTAVEYNKEPYTKYEHLANILEDKPSIPKYNKFTGNILINSGTIATAWLRSVTLEKLIADGGCEYSEYICSIEDLTDYAGGDYTVNKQKAEEIGFIYFDNVFGIQ